MKDMKARIAFIFLLMATGVLTAGEDSIVDLYAGWSWMPFSYYDYPYRYGGYPLGGLGPQAGIAVPLSACDDTTLSAPYGYGPFWGYAYGVRLKLKRSREFTALSESLLPPPPGSAPLEAHNLQLEKQWDKEIEPFLGALTPEWQKQLQTNSTPQKIAARH